MRQFLNRYYLLILFLPIFQSTHAAEYYWVNGSGFWSDLTHWANVSGGPGSAYAAVPTSNDNVHFDNASFSAAGQTLTIDQTQVSCKSMDWSGAQNSPTLTSSPATNILAIYGSLTFVPGMTVGILGPLIFAGNSNCTITLAGKTLSNTVTFNGAGGIWDLLDGFSTSTSAGSITLTSGTLNTNGNPINAYAFISNSTNTRALNLGSSVINLWLYTGSFWNVTSTGMTLNAGTSTIIGNGHFGGFNPTFSGGNLIYYDLIFAQLTDHAGSTAGNNTFNDVTFNAVAGSAGNLGGNNTIRDVYCNGVGGAGVSITGNNTIRNVTFNGPGTIGGGSNTITGTALFNRDGILSGNNTFTNLTFSASRTYTLTSGKTQTINGAFSANGTCSSPITIKSNTTSGTTISHPSGPVNLNYVYLNYITATGGATFSASNSIDLGNNTGWTITSPLSANLYWIGNSGNWSDGNHWATSSGGSPSGCAPTSLDNVFFDVNSFSMDNQTVTIDIPTANCRNIDWTGMNRSTTFTSVNLLNVYGSLTLSPTMTLNFTGPVSFEATTPGQTITSAGKAFGGTITFNGIGGGWTLQDGFATATNNGTITLNNGYLNTNSKAVTGYAFVSTSGNTRSLDLGSSVINLWLYTGSFWNVTAAGMTLNSGTSTIIGNGHFGGFNPTFSGGNLVYYDLIFAQLTDHAGSTAGNNTFNDITFNAVAGSAGNLGGNNTIRDVYCTGVGGAGVSITGNNTIRNVTFNGPGTIGGGTNTITGTTRFNQNGILSGNNTFGTLFFTPSRTYTLTAGKTQTIVGSLDANGTCSEPIIIKSNTTSAADISHNSGNLTVSYVTLNWIKATGGATFTANNSIDLGNNTGWIINSSAGQGLYWVGNSGNWSDGNHWATTSGGTPSGCAPTSLDDVFFDVNSFSLDNQTVTIDIPTASCRNMDWTGMNRSTTFTSVNLLNIYGSLTLSPNMTLNFTGPVSFEATTPGQTITSAGKAFGGTITFNGIGGGWILQDAFATATNNGTITLNNGYLNTNSKAVTGYAFVSTSGNTRSLDLGSSVINLWLYTGSFWNVTAAGMTLNSGTSTIIGNGHFGGFNPTFSGGNLVYYDLIFAQLTDHAGSTAGNNTFNDITFNAVAGSAGNLGGNNTIRDVYCTGVGGAGVAITGNNTIRNVTFNGPGTIGGGTNTITGTTIFNQAGSITGNNTFGNLNFTPGFTYTLTSGKTQTIVNSLNISGNGSFPVRIQSSSPGTPAIFFKSSGYVCVNYIRISDNTAMGGATFFAGLNSQDLGGNLGWDFSGSGGGVLPVVTISSNQSDTICLGTNVTYTAVPENGGIPMYDWYINGVSQQSGATETFSSSTLMNGDTLVCVMTSTASCASQNTVADSSRITVNNPVNAGTIAASPDTICKLGTALLAYTGDTTAGVQWLKRTGSGPITPIQGATSSIYETPNLSQTTYYYVIAGSANCSDTTAALEVFITNILPTASFTQTSQDLTVTFTATVSSGVNAYSWDFGDSQSASEPNPVHTYAAEGTYSVCLTVNNGPLCSFTKCNDISVSVTGIDKSSRHVSWMVYPNPMNEILLLRGSNLKTIKAIECYDAAGRMVFGKTSIQVMDETIQMNVSMLERGIYFLKIKTDDFESTRQLIKFQE